jgi:hypothetical protein
VQANQSILNQLQGVDNPMQQLKDLRPYIGQQGLNMKTSPQLKMQQSPFLQSIFKNENNN